MDSGCVAGGRNEGRSLHLLAAKDEALLHRRDAFLLLDLLLDLGDLVVGLDIELNLLAREGADPAQSASVSTYSCGLCSYPKLRRHAEATEVTDLGGVALTYLISMVAVVLLRRTVDKDYVEETTLAQGNGCVAQVKCMRVKKERRWQL